MGTHMIQNTLKMPPIAPHQLICVFLSLFLFGCATPPQPKSGDGPGQPTIYQTPSELQVRNLPKSRIGNMDSYVVFGKRYYVMDSAEDFAEEGIASWYGSKFHGRKTSSGEVYNMYDMTAAHKHLPLPTFVEVTNLDNGNQVIVKVNDRGPFSGTRVIDMSYAAARELGMLEAGTANVRIRGLSTHHVSEQVVEAGDGPHADNPAAAASQSPQATARPVSVSKMAVEGRQNIAYTIQLGAFSEEPNAHQLVASIGQVVDLPAYVEWDNSRALFRVRMGPFMGGEQLDKTLQELISAGIENYALPVSTN